MNWYLEVLKKYADFSGRAQRKEYWMFMLFHVIAIFLLSIIDAAMGTIGPEGGLGVLGVLYSLATLLPVLAVTARRLHDIGRTGWWQLIYLVPLAGAIVMLVFLVLDSESGDNSYGANPKRQGE